MEQAAKQSKAITDNSKNNQQPSQGQGGDFSLLYIDDKTEKTDISPIEQQMEESELLANQTNVDEILAMERQYQGSMY